MELEAAQAQLAATEREQRVTHQTRLVELARQQGELEEQLSLASAERDRNAGAVARAALTREQLASAHEELRAKDEQIARLNAERRSLQTQLPSLNEGKVQLLAKQSELENALSSANGRCATLAQQLAEMEQIAASRQQESASMLQARDPATLSPSSPTPFHPRPTASILVHPLSILAHPLSILVLTPTRGGSARPSRLCPAASALPPSAAAIRSRQPPTSTAHVATAVHPSTAGLV